MANRKEKRKSRNRRRIIILLAILVVLLSFIGSKRSLAKYVYNAVHNYYLSSKGFYFNCDKITTNYSEYEIENNWSGAESYTITVNLNSKKNDLVFAEPNISYTVSIANSNNIQCTLSKQTGTIVGSAQGGINEDYFTITVDPVAGTTLTSGQSAWVDLVITSTEPYTEVLTGRLIIETGTDDITYEIVDSEDSPYIEVNINNSLDEAKDITLQFDPTVVLLDMTSRFSILSTDEVTQTINGYNYVNSVTSVVNPLETVTVKFYKIDASQNYEYRMGDSTNSVVQMSY